MVSMKAMAVVCDRDLMVLSVRGLGNERYDAVKGMNLRDLVAPSSAPAQ